MKTDPIRSFDRIGIIGAGKAGTTLGRYLALAGKKIAGIYSRTRQSADEAATFIGTRVFDDLSGLVEVSDVLFITTPDEQIPGVWQQIRNCPLQGRLVCHFSGSLSSHVFSDIREFGGYGASVHPMFAFNDKFTAYRQFHTANLTIEGQEQAVALLKKEWQALGHQVFTLAPEDKMKYHAAASLASNAMVALMQVSVSLMEECGFTQQQTRTLLDPLIEGNVRKMLDTDPVQALTGPVERGDERTVRGHLQALQGTQAISVYESLAPVMLALAQKKNPDRDFRALEELLKP